MKKVDQAKLAAIKAAVSSISETLKGGTTGGLQNHTDASGDTKMAGQRNSYLDKIAEAVAAAEEQAAADQAANAQQEPEMEMSPEEEELVASLAAQGLDENQIMEVLGGIEEESAMLEEAQEAQADAIVEELSAQGLAPEEILEVVAANAEEEAMAEAEQDQIAAMHGYVPYLDKQAGVWQDTLKRILAPGKKVVRSYQMSQAGNPAGVIGGRFKSLGTAGKRMWNSGAMGQAQMIGAPVAGIAGLGGAGYAAMPEPSWQDRFAALQGYNPYIDKRAAIADKAKRVMQAVAAPGKKALDSYRLSQAGNPAGVMGGRFKSLRTAGKRMWNSGAMGQAQMIGVPALGIAGLGGAGYAMQPEPAPWYTLEGLRDMLAYNNGYNPYLDKQANAFTQGMGRVGSAIANPLQQARQAYALRMGMSHAGRFGGRLNAVRDAAARMWNTGAMGQAQMIGAPALGVAGLGAAGYAAMPEEEAWYDRFAGYDQYNPYIDKTAANWGALAAPAWGAVKGFGQRAGQFVKGLPGMAAANPWATAGIGAGLATGIGAGAYGLMNQEPSPDEQEFVQWLLNTPEGQQYLAAAAGGLGGAALGAGAGYMAGGGMGAGIGAGLGALGGGFAGYNMPDYTGQY